MAAITPTKIDPGTGLIIDVAGTPSGLYDSAFDSHLIRKTDCVENHTLTLVLKVNLNRVSTFGLPLFVAADADGNLFWIRPWKPRDWQEFQAKFKKQCMTWTNKFWLIPPAGFTKLDVKVGSQCYRPNVYCHLYVHFTNGPTGAHRTIDVVNLDRRLMALQAGVPEGSLNSGDFRSHEALYDSFDTEPRTNQSVDDTGTTQFHINYLTIVHEIGHALGLPHIGVSKDDPLCKAAVFLDGTPEFIRNIAPAIFQGGSNSHVCYGEHASPDRSANVMGSGSSFSKENAQPWRDRIAFHTHTKPADWQVSLGKIAPKPV